MVRIMFLMRTNSRLRDSAAKMEKQVLTQHQEILAVRQDSNAWRGEMQRMFDAFRAEFTKRLAESDQRYQGIQQKQQEVAKTEAAEAAPAKSSELLPMPSVAIS
jgi:predicted phage gp36 major capsid-like protein